MMMQAPMTTTTSTSTLPCVASCATAAAIAVGGMAEQAMLSHFDSSNKNAAVVVGKVKGQNGADGNDDDDDDDGGVVVVAKMGLKIGRKMVVWGAGGNSSKF